MKNSDIKPFYDFVISNTYNNDSIEYFSTNFINI